MAAVPCSASLSPINHPYLLKRANLDPEPFYKKGRPKRLNAPFCKTLWRHTGCRRLHIPCATAEVVSVDGWVPTHSRNENNSNTYNASRAHPCNFSRLVQYLLLRTASATGVDIFRQLSTGRLLVSTWRIYTSTRMENNKPPGCPVTLRIWRSLTDTHYTLVFGG